MPGPAHPGSNGDRNTSAAGTRITKIVIPSSKTACSASWHDGTQLAACRSPRQQDHRRGASGAINYNIQVMVTLRNLGIAIFKLAGAPNIAATCRSHARDATRVLATLGLGAS